MSKVTEKKSALMKQAEKLFLEYPSPGTIIVPDVYTAYPEAQKIVQSFTTYSIGEDPIPNFAKAE